MISKEDFIKYMELYKKEFDFFNSLDGIFRSNRDIMGDTEIFYPASLDAVIELIEIDMGLKADVYGYTTLSWWVYECEFGSRTEMVKSLTNDFLPKSDKYHNPDISSLSKLYDYLVWESTALSAQ